MKKFILALMIFGPAFMASAMVMEQKPMIIQGVVSVDNTEDLKTRLRDSGAAVDFDDITILGTNSAGNKAVVKSKSDKAVQVWDLTNGELIATIEHQPGATFAITE